MCFYEYFYRFGIPVVVLGVGHIGVVTLDNRGHISCEYVIPLASNHWCHLMVVFLMSFALMISG